MPQFDYSFYELPFTIGDQDFDVEGTVTVEYEISRTISDEGTSEAEPEDIHILDSEIYVTLVDEDGEEEERVFEKGTPEYKRICDLLDDKITQKAAEHMEED